VPDANPIRSVEDVVAVAEQEWRQSGVAHHDIATLAADLRLDLAAAAADGAPLDQLIGGDIRAFARRLADEAGVRRIPYEYGRLLLTALAGAAPAAVAGWALLWWAFPFGWLPEPQVPPLALFVALSVAVLAGALFLVRTRMREVPQIGRTVAAMALLVPVAGLAATPLTMGFASLTDYSTLAPVLAFEAAIVTAALAGATLLARRWALRQRDQPKRG